MTRMRLHMIVAGGRDFDDEAMLGRVLDHHVDPEADVILHGACPTGADALADKWARRNFAEVRRFPADWDRYGRRAGPIRNQEMAREGSILIAFWDGKSRGTKGMIDLALCRGLEVHVYRY